MLFLVILIAWNISLAFGIILFIKGHLAAFMESKQKNSMQIEFTLTETKHFQIQKKKTILLQNNCHSDHQ